MLALNIYWIHPQLIAPGMLRLDLEAPERDLEFDEKHVPNSHIFTLI